MRDLINLIETKTKCQTPGANYKFETHGKKSCVNNYTTIHFRIIRR
jgi:hypothetical protein